MKPKSTLRSFLLFAGSSLLAISYSQAAQLYWDSNGTGTAGAGDTPTGTWGTDVYWSTDSTGANIGSPVLTATTTSLDDLFFSADTDAVNAYAVGLNSAIQNARLVTFEDGTATLSTGTLSLGNGGGLTVTTGTVTGTTISSGLTLAGIQTFNVAAGRTLTLDTGTFTRNTGTTLNVLSTGTITTTMTGLDSASMVNDIIGPWASHGSGASTRYATIDGSNNIVGLTGTAAATAAAVTNTGGTFNYDVAAVGTLGAGANINTLRYTGAAGTIAGALTTRGIMNVSGNALTLSGTVSGGGELVVNTANGNVSFSSILTSATTALVKAGPGRLTTHNAATTFTGPVNVNGGVLQYGDQIDWLTTGNITLSGGVMEQRWTQSITKTQGSGPGQIQITGGESGFSENGATGLTWNIGAITWGSATFNPSKFVLQTAASQNGSSVTMAAASTFNLGGATRTILVNSGSVGNASATIAGAISNGGLIKEGAGLLALNATNSYAAGTTISQGTLRFDTRLSMPATGTVTVSDGTALGVTVAGSGTTWGSGTGVAGIAGLTSTANSGEGYGGQTGPVVNFDGNSFLNLNVTGNVTESNDIGNGSATSIRLIKSGASTLTLTGNNSHTGGTTLSAGALAIGSANALSSGTLFLNGGTIQSNDATARIISNAVTIGGDFTVGGTGDLTFSNTGASALGATRTITVNTGRNATFAQAFNGSGAGITKAGAGILTLTGNNSYTGATTLNAGTIVLNNDGDVTGSAVSFAASNTGLTITGGSGVTSTWNAGGGNFGTANTAYNNIQVLIDGAGFAGSARVTNVGILNWGRTATSSTITLTNGGQMNVNGEVRIGNPYYSEAGGANLTIGGGTATSTFTGTAASSDFYIGYGERTGSKNNVVTVGSGGVLTGIRDMVVGHVFDAQNNANPSTNNQLLVTGTGTASMRGISLGFANAASSRAANANIVSVTSGGTLTSTGAILIGRANLAGSQSNSNTMTVSGTGSTWNAGNQNVTVGSTSNATAVSNNNILTVGLDGVVSNVAALTVGSGAGTETGNQLVVNGSLTATSVTVNANNTLAGNGTITGLVTVNGTVAPGTSIGTLSVTGNTTIAGTLQIEVDGGSVDLLAINGNVNISAATLSIVPIGAGATQPSYTILTYTGTLTPSSGPFFAEGTLPVGYTVDYTSTPGQIKLVSGGAPVGYAAWQSANGAGIQTLDQDHDNDGVDNGTEFFIGGTNNTTGFTALPPVVNTGGTLSVTWPKGSGYNGTYPTHFVVETSDTLTGTWTVETLGGGNITDSPGSVKYTFPGGPAYTGKKFARLKVTGP